MGLTLADLFPLDDFRANIDEGYVNVQSHEALHISIANYSHACQYDRVWNAVTTQCRGLIYDSSTLEVIARPFPKFFNLGELTDSDVPTLDFRVSEKLDGSLGVLYPDDYPIGSSYAIATRGSFVSDQAIHATAILKSRYLPNFRPNPDYTYLFEIIYPGNRIVVDYKDRDDLVLIEVLETATHAIVTADDDGWPVLCRR